MSGQVFRQRALRVNQEWLRRMRLKMEDPDWLPATTNLVSAKDLQALWNGQCAICERNLEIEDNWHVDHIVPVFSFGLNVKSNVQVLCYNCNRYTKANKKMETVERQKWLADGAPPIQGVVQTKGRGTVGSVGAHKIEGVVSRGENGRKRSRGSAKKRVLTPEQKARHAARSRERRRKLAANDTSPRRVRLVANRQLFAVGQRICASCNKRKLLTDFARDRGRWKSTCNKCRRGKRTLKLLEQGKENRGEIVARARALGHRLCKGCGKTAPFDRYHWATCKGVVCGNYCLACEREKAKRYYRRKKALRRIGATMRNRTMLEGYNAQP